jgi:Aspartyl/Asparaginyl beta-hydroxylase
MVASAACDENSTRPTKPSTPLPDPMLSKHLQVLESIAINTTDASPQLDDDNNNGTNDSTTTTNATSEASCGIEYSPCSNTGESHTSTIDEIQQQHKAAIEFLAQQQQQSISPPPTTTEEIPIHHKRYPIIHYTTSAVAAMNTAPMTATIDMNTIYCWSSRGTVDVTRLQNLIRHGYNQSYNYSNRLPATTAAAAVVTTRQNKNNNKDQQQHTAAAAAAAAATDISTSIKNTSTTMNYWDPMVAVKYNVLIRRPSHDAWGIPKIVFLYCDDFIQQIYTFPWWWQQQQQQKQQSISNDNVNYSHDKKDEKQNSSTENPFRAAIQPVLDLLHIPVERVVRMLLASLPSNSTIPLHYDTGEWVKYTHRIHVPILVHNTDRILFRCGKTPTTLQTISCHPGHVFEINNQMYHTVSNCDTDYRVHLILDYLDDAYVQQQEEEETNRTPEPPSLLLSPQRHLLQRGEMIYQTRRSIDRMVQFGTRKTPTFMILGSQKAGTTYLFECIMAHPLAIKPKQNRRETHSLDWNYKDYDSIQKQKQFVQSFYYYQELQYHPSCFTGDSTPSYLIDHVRVIPRINRIYENHPSLKFIVLCRHPIPRAISHYAMVTSTVGTPAQITARGKEWCNRSFVQIAIIDLIHMKQCGLIPYWTIPGLTIHTVIEDGKALQFISDWIDTAIFNPDKFHTFTGSVQEEKAWTKYVTMHVPLRTGSYGLLSRGLYALQIRTWMKSFPPTNFLIYKFEAMTNCESLDPQAQHDTSTTTTTTTTTSMRMMNQIWDHLQVPQYEVSDEILHQPQNARDYDSSDIIVTSSKLYTFLQRFYQPHNDRLQDMMEHTFAPHQRNYSTELWNQHWDKSSSIQWDSNLEKEPTLH